MNLVARPLRAQIEALHLVHALGEPMDAYRSCCIGYKAAIADVLALLDAEAPPARKKLYRETTEYLSDLDDGLRVNREVEHVESVCAEEMSEVRRVEMSEHERVSQPEVPEQQIDLTIATSIGDGASQDAQEAIHAAREAVREVYAEAPPVLSPCAICGATESSDGDFYRLCGPCRWKDQAAEAPPTLDATKEELHDIVNSLERALAFAYRGTAEHGSFLSGTTTEYTPSVFLTLNRLKAALRVSDTARSHAEQQLAKHRHDTETLIDQWNAVSATTCQEVEAAEAQLAESEARANAAEQLAYLNPTLKGRTWKDAFTVERHDRLEAEQQLAVATNEIATQVHEAITATTKQLLEAEAHSAQLEARIEALIALWCSERGHSINNKHFEVELAALLPSAAETETR